jgi:hypothetical protein
MISNYPLMQEFSPIRSPSWRWERACYLVDHRRNFSRLRDDEETSRAMHYIRASQSGLRHRTLQRRFPKMDAAWQLLLDDGATRCIVQARILARQSSGIIAILTGVPVPVIDVYEAVFYNCRDRIDAKDWVLAHAISAMPIASSDPDGAVVLRSFAYFGGPLVLELVSPYVVGGKDLFSPLDLSTPEGRREQTIRLAVAAQMLPHDPATCRKLQKVMLIVQERGRKRSAQRSPMSMLARDLHPGMHVHPSGKPCKDTAALPSTEDIATVAAQLREVAQAA